MRRGFERAMVTTLRAINEASTKTAVELFQNPVSPEAERDQAFILLTYKFRKEVLNKCEILCTRFGYGSSTAEIIASNTFEAYARKGKFDELKAKKGKSYDQSFLLYLLKIAEHEVINYYRDIERKKNNPYDGSEQLYFDLPEFSFENLDPETIIELNVLKKVSKSHRAIYLTYKVHTRPGFKMPRLLLERLRSELGGISQNTVNVYLKQIRDEIDRAKEAYTLIKTAQNNGR
ncbi:MAG: hypothetical protein RIB86_06330 [Imperialibacter sp.]